MLPDPCPCTILQCGVRALAICSIVKNFLSILIYTVLLVPGGLDVSDSFFLKEAQASFLSSDLLFTSHSIQIVLLIFLFCHIIALGLDIVLYLGAQKRNVAKCWAWLGFMLVVFLYEVINFIFKLSGYSAIPREHLVTDVIIEIIDFTISIYLLFVVYAFIMEIRNQPDPQLNPANQVSIMAQPQGSVYRAMEAGTYYTAEQPNYPIESQPLNQLQSTSAPALLPHV